MSAVRLERAVRSHAVTDDIAVSIATLRVSAGWSDATRSRRRVGAAVATPLAARRRRGGPVRVPLAGRGPAGLLAALVCGGAFAPPGEEHDMDEIDRISTVVPELSRADEIAAAMTAAGSGQGVVGPAITAGDRVVVPLIETVFGGGFGSGGGSDGEDKGGGGLGGGGGGFGRSRSVAIVEVTPDSVQIRPVIDKTAIVLAAIGAGLGLARVLRHAR